MTDQSTTDTWLRRIHALLAKAESTEFPDEAEALLAKAQELMTRHAIDDAMLRAAGPPPRSHITTTIVMVEPPYAGPKASLLHAVAKANHCRLILTGTGADGQRCHLVGYDSDIGLVSMLYSALSVQATRSLLAATAEGSVRSFRHTFLLAYACRIGERLQEAHRSAQAEVETTGRSVELALLDRAAAVDQAVNEAFPRLGAVRRRASSGAGLISGRAAANRADIGTQRLTGTQPTLRQA